jgi:hypothetical protein
MDSYFSKSDFFVFCDMPRGFFFNLLIHFSTSSPALQDREEGEENSDWLEEVAGTSCAKVSIGKIVLNGRKRDNPANMSKRTFVWFFIAREMVLERGFDNQVDSKSNDGRIGEEA